MTLSDLIHPERAHPSAGLLAVLALLAGLALLHAVPPAPLPDSDVPDWHGNVARSIALPN